MAEVYIIGSADTGKAMRELALEMIKMGHTVTEVSESFIETGRNAGLSIEQLERYNPEQIESSLANMKVMAKSKAIEKPVCFPGNRLAKYKSRTRW